MKVPEDLLGILEFECESEGLAGQKSHATGLAMAIDHVTEWFAAHELVDLSLCGPQCPAWYTNPSEVFMDGTVRAICRSAQDGLGLNRRAPTGQPCPVLAARKETT